MVVEMFMKVVKSIFCNHEYQAVRNAQGKQVLHFDGITEWKCCKCKQTVYSQHLDRVK